MQWVVEYLLVMWEWYKRVVVTLLILAFCCSTVYVTFWIVYIVCSFIHYHYYPQH